MKLTESHLRAIIKEELEALLSEERRETDPEESEEGYEGAEAAKRMRDRIKKLGSGKDAGEEYKKRLVKAAGGYLPYKGKKSE
jgi:hypothetical protein